MFGIDIRPHNAEGPARRVEIDDWKKAVRVAHTEMWKGNAVRILSLARSRRGKRDENLAVECLGWSWVEGVNL